MHEILTQCKNEINCFHSFLCSQLTNYQKETSLKFITMKKILLVVGFVFAGIVANAQFYAGGSLGFGMTSQKLDNGDKVGTETNFSIVPEVGYSLNDRLDLGISIGFGMDQYKPEGGEKTKSNAFMVAPYVRYSFVEFGRFKVMAKASLYAAFGEDVDKVKTTDFGLAVAPVLGYNLSDNFILLANLNCFALGFDYNKVKDGPATTTFGLGFDSNNVANLGGGEVPFTIGFAYIF